MRALDPGRYDAVPVFVTGEGMWLLSSFESGKPSTPQNGIQLSLVPGGRGRRRWRQAASAMPRS